MFKRFNRQYLWFLLIVLATIGVIYAWRASTQQIQNAQQDTATTNAFLDVLPAQALASTETTTLIYYPIGSQATLAPTWSSSIDSLQATAPATVTNASLFDTMLAPFVAEARKRRAALAKTDPDYFKRIDRVLNEGRINFLLFGYGVSHEPPLTEKSLIGSQTIISYDLRTHQADIISFTHDIRAPEIEREMTKRGTKTAPIRIDQAYNVGGFKLMRQTLEDATGLSIDFQITFKDTVLQGLVDSVFQGVDVDVPESFDVHPFYLDDVKYEQGHFDQGVQKLNGRQVIQFIKTVPVAAGAYDKVLEHNSRKALVLSAILQSLAQNYTDKGFWLRLSSFVAGEMVKGTIVYDFDPMSLIVNNIGAATNGLARAMNQDNAMASGIPTINRSKYIVDAAQGDGGVQWVTANAAENPITQKDVDNGVYPTLDMEVPIHANPYGDLVTEYWTSVRMLIRQALNAPTVIYNSPTP